MKCENCNQQLSEDAMFCIQCGTKIESSLNDLPTPISPEKYQTTQEVTYPRYPSIPIVSKMVKLELIRFTFFGIGLIFLYLIYYGITSQFISALLFAYLFLSILEVLALHKFRLLQQKGYNNLRNGYYSMPVWMVIFFLLGNIYAVIFFIIEMPMVWKCLKELKNEELKAVFTKEGYKRPKKIAPKYIGDYSYRKQSIQQYQRMD